MACLINIVTVALTLIVLSSGLPTGKEEEEKSGANNSPIVCPTGESVGETEKCVEVRVLPQQKPVVKKPTNGTAPLTKRQQFRRKKLQKKLNKEIREIKRLLLDGPTAVNTTCPAGQVATELGICVDSPNDAAPEVVPVKSEKAQRLQKKVEKELEKALKREIQNEIRRRKSKEKKKTQKKKRTGPEPGTASVATTVVTTSKPAAAVL